MSQKSQIYFSTNPLFKSKLFWKFCFHPWLQVWRLQTKNKKSSLNPDYSGPGLCVSSMIQIFQPPAVIGPFCMSCAQHGLPWLVLQAPGRITPLRQRSQRGSPGDTRLFTTPPIKKWLFDQVTWHAAWKHWALIHYAWAVQGLKVSH